MRGNEIEQGDLGKNGHNRAPAMNITRANRYGMAAVGACEAPVSTDLAGNVLMRQVPPSMYRRLQPHIKRVELSLDDYLYRPHEEMETVDFPETAVVS